MKACLVLLFTILSWRPMSSLSSKLAMGCGFATTTTAATVTSLTIASSPPSGLSHAASTSTEDSPQKGGIIAGIVAGVLLVVLIVLGCFICKDHTKTRVEVISPTAFQY